MSCQFTRDWGKRDVDVAHDSGYHTGSGVNQLIRRLKQQAEVNPPCGPLFNN
jgi:hypothetical protein